MKMNKPVIRSGLALWLLVALLLGGCTAKGEPVPPMGGEPGYAAHPGRRGGPGGQL